MIHTLTPEKKRLISSFIELLHEQKAPQTYKINNQKLRLFRLSRPFELKEAIDWLDTQALFPKVFWKDRDLNEVRLGIGQAFALHEIPHFSDSPDEENPPQFFGSEDFFNDDHKTGVWKDFPHRYYFLPLIEVQIHEGRAQLTINLVDHQLPLHETERSLSWILEGLLPEKEHRDSLDEFTERIDVPPKEIWSHNILKSLDKIKEGEIDKIVHARSTLFSYKQYINPITMLKKILSTGGETTFFGLLLSKHQGFVGATPELFYRRVGKEIVSEAIAGTKPRGKTEKEDEALREELISCAKENREFDFVSETIEKELSPFCKTPIEVTNKGIIKTKTVQHLKKKIRAVLKNNTHDEKIFHALHPTPALGGLPKKRAQSMLYDMELFDRGYYASPIGWFSPKSSNLYVAIRSALVNKREVRIYAGTGIVDGSQPQKEWQELEHKMAHFL